MKIPITLIFFILIVGTTFSGCVSVESDDVYIEIKEPKEGETLAGEYILEVAFNSTGENFHPSRVEYHIDADLIDLVTRDMDRALTYGHLNTTDFEDGEHVLKVVAYWNGTEKKDWKSDIWASDEINVIFDN